MPICNLLLSCFLTLSISMSQYGLLASINLSMLFTIINSGLDNESIVKSNGTVDTQPEEQILPLHKPRRRVRFRLKHTPGQCDADDACKRRKISAWRYYMKPVIDSENRKSHWSDTVSSTCRKLVGLYHVLIKLLSGTSVWRGGECKITINVPSKIKQSNRWWPSMLFGIFEVGECSNACS